MGGRLKVAVLASGRGTDLQSVIDGIEAGKLDAQIVLAGSDVENAMALERARKHGLPAVFFNPQGKTKEDYYGGIARELKNRGAELVVLAGFMRVIPPAFVKEFEDRVMNIHPALLPSFPGLRAQKQALDYGAKVSGCTVHFVTPAVDAGPVILQKAVEVREGDSEETLSGRILEQEHRLLPKAIQLYAEGRLKIEGRVVKINWKGFEDKWK